MNYRTWKGSRNARFCACVSTCTSNLAGIKCPAKFEVHVDTHCAAELIGEVWKSLSICGAKGKHSVDKKADRSEQREWSLVEGEALRQASGRKTSGAKTVETGKIRPLFVAY